MSLKSVLFAAAIVASAGAATRADAAFFYAFGFGGTVAGQLTLGFSGGGSTTIDTGFNQGWWSDQYPSRNDNPNYMAGDLFGRHFNDFFVFDLPGRNVAVTSATLRLPSETILGGPMEYTLWDVTTPIAHLENKIDNPNAAIYADLGSGIQYGDGVMLTDADSGQFLDFALNRNGVAAINSALGGWFAIGGHVSQVSVRSQLSVFSQISVSIPEPSSVAVLGTALLGFGLYRRGRSGVSAERR